MEVSSKRNRRENFVKEKELTTENICTPSDYNLFGIEEIITFEAPSKGIESNLVKTASKDEDTNGWKEHSYGQNDDWSLGMPFAVDTVTRMKFETDGLRQQISQKARQNQELQTKILNLMEEKEKEENLNDKLNTKILNLMEEKKKEESLHDMLKAQIRRKDLEIDALKKRVVLLNTRKANYYSNRKKQRESLHRKWVKTTVHKLMAIQGTNFVNSNNKKRNIAKPTESEQLQKQIAERDQEIQDLKTQNSSLQSQIVEKEYQIQELKLQLESSAKERTDCASQTQDLVINTENSSKIESTESEKGTEQKEAEPVDARRIAVEALSSLHCLRVDPGILVSTKIEDPTSSNGIEGEEDLLQFDINLDGDNSTTNFKNNKPSTKKPHQRNVQNGYFRWTRERNIQLINAMIDILNLSQPGPNRMKESEFLRKVWEHCGNLGAENKIRDNVNNLLRRYLYIHKYEKSIAEIKADHQEYKRLLESIRKSLENNPNAFGVDVFRCNNSRDDKSIVLKM
ncbi:unnamed protein product [Allacma fusca]|uniref:Uncharacterized protein n=1 Tax=Allacma fusca TaxID=39272 RepID=A0A8J2L5S5_9HEXA|nr:unnamed protein product [Allacma fusca]